MIITQLINNNRNLNPKIIPKMMLLESGGGELGIPLNIFSNIYTNLHYGYDITTVNSILIQFLLGYYVYGIDRFKDAEEFEKFLSMIENIAYDLKETNLKDLAMQYF